MKYVMFLGSRLGCKLNDIKFFEDLIPTNSKTIVEGYAGSFSLIRKNYFDKDVKLHINDNDKTLIKVLEIIQKDNKINEYIDSYKTLLIKHGKNAKEMKKSFNELEIPIEIKQHILNGYTVRGFFKPFPNSFNINPLKDLLNKCEITNIDISVILIRYQQDKDAFLFLDPPYLDSDNTQYKGNNRLDNNNYLNDNTVHYINLLKFLEDKKTVCKVMIILNGNAIINYLFKNFIKKTYEKTYQITKNKATHVIITNY
jgi:site-specific DNA-adenine methylase